MDFSVLLAAVGSFVVSERVIRAKASVLVVLSSVAVWDLCRHSHDPASLRVYRGPAMAAFTISCVAASLRIWRRSGVACDELLFLPGTPYAAEHGVRCPAVDAAQDEGKGLAESASGLELSGLDSLVGADSGDDEVGVDLVLEDNRGRKHKTSDADIQVHGLSDSDSDSDNVSETDLNRTSSSVSSGPVIIPIPLDLGPDAAAGIPIGLQASPLHQQTPHPTPRQQRKERRAQRQRDRQRQGGHQRRFSDTDLIPLSPRTGESDEAGGGLRTRCNTHDQVLDEEMQLQSSSLETFEDEDLDMLDEGQGKADSSGSRQAADSSDAPAKTQLDENKGLKDESMIRYLLCSRQGERLRRRRYRRLDREDTASDDQDGSAQGQAAGKEGTVVVPATPSTASRGTESKGPVSKKTDEVDVYDATYSPSGPSVAGAAVDLCLPVLFNFHMFVVLSNSRSSKSSSNKSDDASSNGTGTGASDGSGDMDPRILPLIFLSVLFIRSVIPPKGRMRFWSTLKYTTLAPLYSVYFRDAFIGDVMTSLVKPLMDIAYCIFYYCISVFMILSANHTLDDAGEILEKSWVLHNIVLPSIAILPLWWKFLQTLRQAWDHRKRWPYLGNAFKYLSAALVVMYGMAHREGKRSWWWVTAFVASCLYQIWWDTFMDWELFVVVPKSRRDGMDGRPANPTLAESARACRGADMCSFSCISSIPASARCLLPLYRLVIQPVTDAWRRLTVFCSSHTLALRSQRLYRREQFYLRVFAYNFLSRFVWMLSFIPAYHFSRDGREIRTFAIDAKTYVGAALSVAEIVRRCLWGILKVELETIKVTDYTPVPTEEEDSSHSKISMATADERFGGKSQPQSGIDMVLSALGIESQSLVAQSSGGSGVPSSAKVVGAGSIGGIRNQFNCSDHFWRRCFLLELIAWAASFVGLGIVSVWLM